MNKLLLHASTWMTLTKNIEQDRHKRMQIVIAFIKISKPAKQMHTVRNQDNSYFRERVNDLGHKGVSDVQITFCILVWMLVMQVCACWENSLRCIVLIYPLFYTCT